MEDQERIDREEEATLDAHLAWTDILNEALREVVGDDLLEKIAGSPLIGEALGLMYDKAWNDGARATREAFDDAMEMALEKARHDVPIRNKEMEFPE